MISSWLLVISVYVLSGGIVYAIYLAQHDGRK